MVASLVAAGGYGLARDSHRDSDGDGIRDEVESSGWLTAGGSTYRTDPFTADTDGDGLTDGDEAGLRPPQGEPSAAFAGYSNPLLPDSDTDGLDDADEADMSLDPLNPDTDDDELPDGREVKVVGSAPDEADTDGDGLEDGYEDANRESQGLDPLWFDVQMSAGDYARDFAKGALAGDLMPEDSLAWFAGNLTGSAATSLPLVGTALGTLADLRDAVAAAIDGDWVGAGYNAWGAVPGGDPVAVPRKASQFLERHPQLAARALAFIARASWIPPPIKAKVSALVVKDWDYLKSHGAADEALIRLQEGRTDLDGLAASIRRATAGAVQSAPFLPDGRAGEVFLEHALGASTDEARRQVRVLTDSCRQGCNPKARVFDVLVDGVAHESKVGYVPWSSSVEAQIRSDAWLVQTGAVSGARWHFFGSDYSHTVGADPRVLDLLAEAGIPFSIHLPGAA